MFEVGLQQVKAELEERVSSSLHSILQLIEDDIVSEAGSITCRYKELETKLCETLQTAEDVVEMDLFKSVMPLTINELSARMKRFKSIVFFLYQHNDMPSICKYDPDKACTPTTISDTLDLPSKMQDLVYDQDARHQQERVAIEKSVHDLNHVTAKQTEDFREKVNKMIRVFNPNLFYNQMIEWDTMASTLANLLKTQEHITGQQVLLYGRAPDNFKL